MERVSCPVCASGEAVPVLRAGGRRMVRCRQCRLVYRNPRPSEADLAVPAGVALAAPQEEWLTDRRAPNFRRFLDGWPGPPGRLLDLGCGSGAFLELAKARGWEAVGVDLSPAAVQYAQERRGVSARCGDLRETEFPSHAFTLVTLWNVLEFVPDPVALLREIHRVLAPGGHLFLRTQSYSFQRLSFRLTSWAVDRPDKTFVFHLTSFSPAPLRLLFAKTGFQPVKVSNSVPTWGDPYRALGGADRLMAAVKVAVYGFAEGLYFLSRGRWVLGSSLEAYARRES